MIEWDQNWSNSMIGCEKMKEVTISVDNYLYDFYRKVGKNAGRTPETVMADALFKLAGELSLRAIDKKQRNQ